MKPESTRHDAVADPQATAHHRRVQALIDAGEANKRTNSQQTMRHDWPQPTAIPVQGQKNANASAYVERQLKDYSSRKGR